jgi:pyridoxine kinase
MAILSIQSAVAYGHVGNAVAVPALQALGHEVWRVDTVTFSNHPGYGRHTGAVHSSDAVAEIIGGLDGIGVMANCDAVLSGYLGHVDTHGPVVDAVTGVKQANPDAIYVLDPVLGDDGKIFVGPGIRHAIQHSMVPVADFVLPNLSELGWLTDTEFTDQAGMLAAARLLLERGPSAVVITGVQEADEIAVYGVAGDRHGGGGGLWRAASARRARRFNGTGDLFAALFTGWYLETRDLAATLAATVAGLDLVTGETERRGTDELAIVPVLRRLKEAGMAAVPAEKIG